MVSLVLKLLVSAAVLIAGQFVYLLGSNYICALKSPVHNLPGPERESVLRGNFPDRTEPNSQRIVHTWFERYGRAIRFFSFLGVKSSSLSALLATLIRVHARLRRSASSTPRLFSMFWDTGICIRNLNRCDNTLGLLSAKGFCSSKVCEKRIATLQI